MTSSDASLHPINLSIGKYIHGAKVTIIDSEFNKIHSAESPTISLSLARGLYQVRIDSAGYYQEEYIKITQPQNFCIEMDRYSSIPAHPFKSTHEYYHKPAEQYSKETTYKKEDNKKPNFLLFIANYDRQLVGSSLPVASDFSFFNDQRTVDIDLNSDNSHINNNDGLLLFSGHFVTGLYFFSYRSDKEVRIFPIYIFDNYQTQFFLRFTSSPDFSSCRIFFSEKMQFDADDTTYCTFEQLLLTFSDYNQYKNLSDEDHINIDESGYLKCLVNILHAVLRTNWPNGKPMPSSLNTEYRESEILVLPDYKYLKNTMETLRDELPMLAFIMYKFSGNDEAVIPLASVMDRVAEFLKYDIFWTSFTNLDSPAEIADAMRKEMIEPSTLGWLMGFVHKTGIFNSGKNILKREDRKWIKEKVLKTLSKEDIEFLNGKMKAFVKSRADAKLIAAKFNIPVTTVLRRYSELKKTYDEMEKSEANLMEVDFFKKKS